jgi:hypothetical protein
MRTDSWLFETALRADVAGLIGDRARASLLLETLAPYAERTALFGWIVICAGPVARPLARLAALLGDWTRSGRLFEQAFTGCASLRSPLFDALTRIDRAEAWVAHPDPEARAQALAAAHCVLSRAQSEGWHALARRCRQHASNADPTR